MTQTITPTMFRAHPILFILQILTGLFIITFPIWYLMIKNEKLVIGSNRIDYEVGVLSKSRSQVNISDIRNVTVNQGLLHRMFGVGTIGISTAGQGNIEILIKGIEDPLNVRDTLIRLRDEATEKNNS